MRKDKLYYEYTIGQKIILVVLLAIWTAFIVSHVSEEKKDVNLLHRSSR